MRLVQGAVGAVVAILVIAFFLNLETAGPAARRMVVVNNFEDARCTMEFVDASRVSFSVRKGKILKRTFPGSRDGFIAMRCHTATRDIEAPGHFHLIAGGLTTVEISAFVTPLGQIDIRYWDDPRHVAPPVLAAAGP